MGLYLTGSFALGDFDLDSDVDFLVIINTDVTEAQELALQAMHGNFYDLETEWAKHLEGSYITRDLVKRRDPAGTLLLYLDNTARECVRSAHCNTLVARWTMHEYGIALAGPEAKMLVDPVVPDDLRKEVSRAMRGWATEILTQPELLKNRWYQAYAVVTNCRMLYTLRNGTVTSKPAAVRWAQGALDSRWQRLIDRAWRDRPNPSLKSRQLADPDDSHSTLEFVKYMLDVMPLFDASQSSQTGTMRPQ